MTTLTNDRFSQYTYTSFPKDLYSRFLSLYLKPFKTSVEHCLDLGCGAGGLIPLLHEQYPECHFVGIDISKAALEAFPKNDASLTSKLELIEGDANLLNGREDLRGKFDLIVSYSVLHYVAGTTAEKVALLDRLLAPNGLAVIDVLPKVPWNLFIFGVVQTLMRTGIWPLAIKTLAPLIAPSFDKNFIEELSRMDYLLNLKRSSYWDLGVFQTDAFKAKFKIEKLEIVPQDSFFTGRKARFCIRKIA